MKVASLLVSAALAVAMIPIPALAQEQDDQTPQSDMEATPGPQFFSQPEVAVGSWESCTDDYAVFPEGSWLIEGNEDEVLWQREVVREELELSDAITQSDESESAEEVDSRGVGSTAQNASMYRLYNPNSGEHFYTANAAERDSVVGSGWNYEGIGWVAPVNSRSPVYRLYSGTDHHYTVDAGERDSLIRTGWSYEGIGWYSDDAKGVPLYRQFNPNVNPSAPTNNSGSHNYTTDLSEHNSLCANGWQGEGIAWYGVKSSPSSTRPTYGSTADLVNHVKAYSYTVKPVVGKFNNIFFVETNNPDPYSFQFIDTSSKYLSQGKTALIKPLPYTYSDIVYSDRSTKRIANKGYLFYNYNCDTDGGTFKLMANKGYSYTDHGSYVSYSDGTNYETGRTVSCGALEDRADYLIRTYASGKTGFFDKMDAVQSGLGSIALYPKAVRDTSKPNASGQRYPCLAVSPYPELSLNEHIESMYQSGDPLFISTAYGFVLDSLGFPGMMAKVAQRIEPSCKIESGWSHAYVSITCNGTTRQYGGAGAGSTYAIYTQFVSKTFRFDGRDIGYGTNASLETMKSKRLEYASKSDAFSQAALAKLSTESVAKVVGQSGAWIRCAAEGRSSKVLCYVAFCPQYGYPNAITYASNAWVGSRYVNSNEMFQSGVKFSDHPTARIILENVTYPDKQGNMHTTSVVYDYESASDSWKASVWYYVAGSSYSYEDRNNLPSQLILTRSQVNQMVASGQLGGGSAAPTAKYLYDGTAEPGTRC